MKQAHSLQRQHRKHGSSATSAFSSAEPTRLFAPVASSLTPTLPHERQERPGHVAQFRHSFDRLSIHPPVPDGGADHEVERSGEQSEMQQTEEQPSSVQRKGTERQPTPKTGEPLQKVADPSPAQGNNTGMPDTLKMGIESLSGLAMDDVRVHYNSVKPAQVDALAYTQGTEIHVGPGQEQHLAHEAWHVVQQKQGRVEPTLQTKGVAINDNEGLEKEADVMGSRATGRIPNADGQTFITPQKTGTPKGVQQYVKVVQRLETTETFMRETTIPALPRSQGIRRIENALVGYHAMNKRNFHAREQTLRAILALCTEYLRTSPSRQQGANELLRQVNIELTYIEPLARSQTSNNDRDKLTLLLQGQEIYLNAVHAGYSFDGTTGVYITDELQPTINSLRNNHPDQLQSFVMADLTALKSLKDNPNTPPITGLLLEGILANEDKISFEEGRPGTALSAGRVSQKYIVKHALNQRMGLSERLGSLAHEITHTVVGETFGNTPIFLSFPSPWPERNEIEEVVTRRRGYLGELRTLFQDDPELSAWQKSQLHNKIAYGEDNKLMQYAANYHASGKINTATRDDIMNLATFADNSLVEYDTVLIQMLVYMALWGISMANPFYTRLREVAREAYDFRQTLGLSTVFDHYRELL